MKIITIAVGELETNCYVLVGHGGGAIVIDPGADAQKIKDVLARERAVCRAIALTHAHADHIGAVRELKEEYGAKIFAHPLEFPALVSPFENLSAYTGGPNVVSPPADVAVSGGDAVETDGLRLEVVHTPGHTPGGISLLLRGENQEAAAIFTGDTLFEGTVGRCDLPGGDFDVLRQSLSKLTALKGNPAIYPGHGRATTLEREKSSNPYLAEIKP